MPLAGMSSLAGPPPPLPPQPPNMEVVKQTILKLCLSSLFYKGAAAKMFYKIKEPHCLQLHYIIS